MKDGCHKPLCLLIRADSSVQIGMGHVMRCLALAQSWQPHGGKVVLASAANDPMLSGRLDREGVAMESLDCRVGSDEDARRTVRLAKAYGAAWVVLDGYGFRTAYQRAVYADVPRVLLLDDGVHSGRFHATAILNQNLHAAPAQYDARASGARLLLGSAYVLLRREFWSWRGRIPSHSGTARRILVTMGGSDADNVTAKVISGLALLSDPAREITVVVGPQNPHWHSLEAIAARSPVPIRLERNVVDMTARLGAADLVICGGGATCWEMAFFGIPMLPVILAGNQQPIVRSLHAAGAAHELGWHHALRPEHVAQAVHELTHSPERLCLMSERGRRLVDGWGCERVIDVLMAGL